MRKIKIGKKTLVKVLDADIARIDGLKDYDTEPRWYVIHKALGLLEAHKNGKRKQ